MSNIYEQLAWFLNELPAGYPRTESGVELRILRKLFTPQEAELFTHLTLIAEEPNVVAYRANQPVEEVRQRLEEMESKGLVSGIHKPERPPKYSARQFVIGFWEGQVNRLDKELVEAFEEYLPSFFDTELWRKAPQMRTIPIGESIPVQTGAMPYERAEEIIRSHTVISVANCICRQEQRLAGKGCTKPLETCLTFDSAARNYVHTGKGRMISQEEAIEILNLADEAGLVLQPTNAQDPAAICACCGCCCGVLRGLKLHPSPGSIASSPFVTAYDPVICSGCGDCIERCQMGAISMDDVVAVVAQERCIGCGLCVTACTTGALTLVRKPESEQRSVPKDMLSASVQLGQARGKMGRRELASMLAKSKKDRLRVRH